MHNHTMGCKEKLKFIPGLNPVFVQDITRENMIGYYLTRGLRWDTSTFLNKCTHYTNFQVFSNNDQVAALRLSFHKNLCLIRDIQVDRCYGSSELVPRFSLWIANRPVPKGHANPRKKV